jgi:8-oxo-dGTP pyrophosphatase MutT (NUDIX family)
MRHAEIVDRLPALIERLAGADGPAGPLPAPPSMLVPVLAGTGELRAITPAPVEELRDAAVLALIIPGTDAEARIVLIERPSYDGHHSGEVGLPGGAVEEHDDDPVATALREAAEEIGLEMTVTGIRVVGLLEPFQIPVSRFHVTPVLAVAAARPILHPDPREVARIVEAPIEGFLPGAPIEIVERTVRGWHLRYGGYRVEDLHVWGATARILGQLGAVLAGR